jgi:hypothetical protein
MSIYINTSQAIKPQADEGEVIMTDIQMVLALVGALVALLATGISLAWYFHELPRQHYREFLSRLTKYGHS